jgi:hypothetical protein
MPPHKSAQRAGSDRGSSRSEGQQRRDKGSAGDLMETWLQVDMRIDCQRLYSSEEREERGNIL